MRLFYTLSIYLYAAFIKVVAPFVPKAGLWVRGRRQWQPKLRQAVQAHAGKVIWVHCASLGEYEQAKPLLVALQQKYPTHHLLLSFFSPSGYEVRKHNAVADSVIYLPYDSPRNAKQFVDICNPILAIFVKYEFWYNYLHVLKNKGVETVFVSAIFRKEQYFFSWYGAWFRRQLAAVGHFFVQNKDSLELLQGIGIKQVSQAGDTRFDSVAQVAQQAAENSVVKAFKAGQPLLLVGSSWPADEALILEVAQAMPQFKILIAPHEIHSAHIAAIKKMFSAMPCALYASAHPDTVAQNRVLILDTMGMLSSLYQYADYTWIGGGFGKGIHNTLEAAVFGMPIFFGPKYKKFDEAKVLVQRGVAISLQSAAPAIASMQTYEQDKEAYEAIRAEAQSYVRANLGSVERIMCYLAASL